METLKIKVRKIGNSKGIVIPKKYLSLIENDNEEISIVVDNDGILLKANEQNPRKGWGAAFKKMAKNNDDKLILPDMFKDEKLPEWK